MADKIPVKARYSGSDVISLGELETGDTIAASYINGTLIDINLQDYGETTNVIGPIGGGTQDIDLTLGNSVSATVDTAETTFTFSNPSASPKGCGFTLILTNGGSETLNWPAEVAWGGGVVATPVPTAAGVDIFTFWTIDGGTIWHGFAASLDSKSGI